MKRSYRFYRQLGLMAGRQFGRLSAVMPVASRRKLIHWLCLCECGRLAIVSSNKLRSVWTQSCGCLWKESIIAASTTHDMSGTTEYHIYRSMISRCYNKQAVNYERYGGRGIRICDRWLECFENFFADMGFRPKGLTLERMDNNGNYELSNCRWATYSEQRLNCRKQVLSTSCGFGHPYSGNEVRRSNGTRECRACINRRNKLRYRKAG